MANEMKMPQLGESIFEGTIIDWLKSEGDTVEEYEVLLEVETDKVTTEITSPFTGTLLKVLVQPGETVQTGVVLALIGEAEEVIDAPSPAPASVPASPPPQEPESVPLVTPVAARVAKEHDIDLSQVTGSGPGGRVVKKDVEPLRTQPAAGQMLVSPVVSRLIAQHNLDLSQIPGTGKGGRVTRLDVLNYLGQNGDARDTSLREAPLPSKPVPLVQTEPSAPMPDTAEPGTMNRLNSVRRAIAEHMVRSVHTSPHVSTFFEVDMSTVMAHRAAHKDSYAERGVNLTLMAYFIHAAATALAEFPMANSRWDDDGIFLHNDIHIGMATALGKYGLIVPVIRHANMKNLLGLAQAVNDLAQRARSKELKPDEVKGATFTVTNHGTSGSLMATPIINQPQAAILGIGRVEDRVVAIRGTIAIRPMCYVGLTFDHRILDGETADTVLSIVKRELESEWSG